MTQLHVTYLDAHGQATFITEDQYFIEATEMGMFYVNDTNDKCIFACPLSRLVSARVVKAQ